MVLLEHFNKYVTGLARQSAVQQEAGLCVQNLPPGSVFSLHYPHLSVGPKNVPETFRGPSGLSRGCSRVVSGSVSGCFKVSGRVGANLKGLT
jgi:hypothetical protein